MDYYKIENIDQFLKHELSAEEMTSYETAMAEDPMLKDAVDGYRFMKEDGVDLEEMLQNSKLKMKQKPLGKQRLLHHRKLITMAASIIILLGLAAIFKLTSGPNISDFDFKDAGLPVHLGTDDILDYSKFTNFYKLGEYENAKKELNILIQDQSNNDTLLYYKACILKEQKNYIEAIEYFKLIKPDSEYFEKSDYQKAMCYWYLNDDKNLLNTLKVMSENPKHLFYHQSLLVLEKL